MNPTSLSRLVSCLETMQKPAEAGYSIPLCPLTTSKSWRQMGSRLKPTDPNLNSVPNQQQPFQWQGQPTACVQGVEKSNDIL